MTIQERKKDMIAKISDLEDEEIIKKLDQVLQEALPDEPRKPREAGWGKGIFTYVSDDFDDFIPPGFNEDNEIFP